MAGMTREGWKTRWLAWRVERSPLFDRAWCRERLEVPAGEDLVRFYLREGWQGCDPSARFSNEAYLRVNPDVRELGICPLAHYEGWGRKEGRRLYPGHLPGYTGKRIISSPVENDQHHAGTGAKERLKSNASEEREEHPLISVIIPTYNRAYSLREACESVLRQTWDHLELIVVDDCSTDDTARVVRELEDPRVRYLCHEENLGACAARNTGVQAAKGEFIAFQDSDDIWLPEKLARQWESLRSSGCDLCFCQYQSIDAEGRHGEPTPTIYPEGEQGRMESVYAIGTQTLLARRELLLREPFDPEMPRFQDLELLLRLAPACRMYFLPEALVEYRVREDSISSQGDRSCAAVQRLMEKHPGLSREYPLLCWQLANQVMRGALREKGGQRRRMGRLAMELDPTPERRRQYRMLCEGIFDDRLRRQLVNDC